MHMSARMLAGSQGIIQGISIDEGGFLIYALPHPLLQRDDATGVHLVNGLGNSHLSISAIFQGFSSFAGSGLPEGSMLTFHFEQAEAACTVARKASCRSRQECGEIIYSVLTFRLPFWV